jgi:hypothetical protein
MNAKKVFYLLIGLTVIIVIATGSMLFFADSFLKKNSEKLTQYKKDEKQVQLDERVYTKANNDLKKYTQLGLRQAVDEALPKEKDQAKAVKEVLQIATVTGVKIEKIQFTDSTLGDKVKTPAANPNGQTVAPSATITQAKPIPGISGVQGIEMTVGLTGANDKTPINYSQFTDFVDKITNNRRSMQISKLTIQPGLKKAELTINIFVKP